MPFDGFLKIAGIDGESTDDKHKGWIEVLSFSMGVAQARSGTHSGSGSKAGQRADFADFNFVHTVDKASPKLFQYCASGEHVKDVSLEVCKAGGDKQKYLVYKFSDVLVSSVRPGGSGQGVDALPVEDVSLNFGKVEITYTVIDAKGKPAGDVSAGWNLDTNAKI
jgi:type VI secretion system secreted protein Hcp